MRPRSYFLKGLCATLVLLTGWLGLAVDGANAAQKKQKAVPTQAVKNEQTNPANESGSIFIPIPSLIKQGKVLKGHAGDVESIAFSPDGKTLASGSEDETIILWETATGEILKTLKGHSNDVMSVIFSPDGKTLASGSVCKMIILWDVVDGKRLKTLEYYKHPTTCSDYFGSLAFSPDGEILVSTTDRGYDGIIVWDVSSGNILKSLKGNIHTYPDDGLAFSPNGRILASAGRSNNNKLNTTMLWDVANWKRLNTLEDHGGSPGGLSFSMDGKIIATTAYKTIILWNVATGTWMKNIEGHTWVESIAFSPDGKILASGYDDGTIILWDSTTGRQIKNLKGHKDDVNSIAFSPDGKTLASGSDDKTIILWDTFGVYLALSSTDDKGIPLIEGERDKKIRELFPPRGEFETTNEYDSRVEAAKIEAARIRREYDGRIKEARDKARQTAKDELKEKRTKLHPYSFKTALSAYNADREGFDADIFGKRVFIKMPRESAMGINEHKDNVKVEGMVKYYDSEKAELVNPFLVDDVTNERFAFGRHTEAVMTASTQKTPPDLTISFISLSEPSGNNILDAGEMGKIKVALKNSGKGAGFAVNLSLTPATALPKGMRFSEKTYIGTINPGEEKNIEVEVIGTEEVQTADVNLKATLTESNGFDSQPIILAFKTKELVPPLIQIAKIDIQDSEGKRVIAKGKEVTLTLSVQNAGSGPARGVVAEIVSKSPDVMIFGENKITIGALSPGESRKTVFSMAVTQRYSGEKTLPVSFIIKEERERFSIRPDIKLALNGEAPELRVVKVEAKEMPVVTAVATGDIETVPTLTAGQRVIGENDMAVVIGIERYRNLPKSDYSYNDAKLVKAYLKAMGFSERNIDYLTDDGATRSGIEKTVEGWLPNRVKKDSRVFVYYSGHGSPDPVTGEAYIVPHDGDPNYLSTTGYPLNRFYNALSKLEAAEVMVVLDSCFSGAGGRSVLAKGARPALSRMKDPILASQNIAVLSSTQGTQISTSFPEKEHGLFTYYFLKAIKEGRKDLTDIYTYLRPIVEDEAKMMNVQQSPSITPDAEKLRGRFSLRR